MFCTSSLADNLKNYKYKNNSAKKKHNVIIVSAEYGRPVRDRKKSLRFELRTGECGSGSDWSDCKNDRERI
jgi:hypothetical protein